MRFNSKTSAALMCSVCAAALSWAPVAGADPVPNVSIIDYQLDLDLDYIAFSLNTNVVEGALGATNLEIDQTALAQLDNAAGRIDAGNFLAIDQEQLSFNSDGDDYFITQVAINRAEAATTQLDTKLGGNQIAVASFNTATFDVAGEDGTGTIALIQSLVDGDNNGLSNSDVHVDLIAANFMDAATAYAGTAIIDAEMANPDYLALADRGEGYDTLTPETINGLQQAAVSLNTLRGTADDGTTAQIDLFGQNLDTTALYDPENAGFYGDTTFLASASNQAIAYSPRPADSRFVAPELVNGLNDPKVSNLDQVAAISLNTISLGAADGTADFVIYSQNENGDSLLNSDINDTLRGDYWGDAAQSATFSDTNYYDDRGGYGGVYGKELFLSNTAVATSEPEEYGRYGSNDEILMVGADYSYYAYEVEHGYDIGNVALDDVSQVAALTINSISQAGEGDLTLKAGTNIDSVEFERADFIQSVDGLDIDAQNYDNGPDYEDYIGDYVFAEALGAASYTGAINYADADTEEGNVVVDTVSQTVQLGLNSISSQGDLNSWAEDDTNGIIQTYDNIQIALSQANELNADNDTSATDSTMDVSAVDQMFNLSLNTVSAAGDMTASLDQDQAYIIEDSALYLEFENDVNAIWLDVNEDGTLNADDLSQIASLRLNTVNVTGDINSEDLYQNLDLGGIYRDDDFNDFEAEVDDGTVAVDGLDQITSVSLNSVSGSDITSPDLDQYAEGLDYFDYNGYDWWPENSVNEIDVSAWDTGDASLANGSQVSVLNVNTIAASGVLSGSVYQGSVNNNAGVVESLYGMYDDSYVNGNTNSVSVYADQDLNGVRNVGGNASLDGMLQTASYNVNTISAAGLSNAYVDQYLFNSESVQSNFAGVDAEWGVASATGVVQTAINRANYMSISTPVVAPVIP